MIEEALLPKTELERAFVQARSWEPMHSWRRGTTDLRGGRMCSAVGIYLALVRSYALDGKQSDCEQTLSCLDQYLPSLNAADKLSAVRVLCNIMDELKDEIEEELKCELLQKLLTKTAVAFTAQIKENKLAVTDALALIKKASECDILGDHLVTKTLEQLSDAIENYKAEGANALCPNATAVPSDEEIGTVPIDSNDFDIEQTESEVVDEHNDSAPHPDPALKRIFDLAHSQGDELRAFQILTEFGAYLLDNKKIEQSLYVYHELMLDFADYSKKSSRKTDRNIAKLLSTFGYKFFVTGYKDEACECLFAASIANIRAQKFDTSTIEETMELAIQAVTSKRYQYWATKLQQLLDLLELSGDGTSTFELFTAQTKYHHRLISTLAAADAKLDLQCISSLTSLLELCQKSAGTPFSVEFLPFVAEILQTRIKPEYQIGLFDTLWNGVNHQPTLKIYDSYIQPLSIITEQVLGSSTPTTFQYYSRIFAQMDAVGMDDKRLIVFWRVLIGLRESIDGHSSPTLLPLLAALAKQYVDSYAFRDCLDIIERVQMMDLNDLNGTKSDGKSIPSYVDALLTLAILNLRIPPNNETLIFINDIQTIVQANREYKQIREEIYSVIVGRMEGIRRDRNVIALSKLLPVLDKIIENFESNEDRRD